MEAPSVPFPRWLEERQKSPATVRAYAAVAAALGTDADPAAGIERAYAAAVGAVTRGSLRPATANVRVAALRAYTEYLGLNHNSWDATYGSNEFVTWLFAQQRGK